MFGRCTLGKLAARLGPSTVAPTKPLLRTPQRNVTRKALQSRLLALNTVGSICKAMNIVAQIKLGSAGRAVVVARKFANPINEITPQPTEEFLEKGIDKKSYLLITADKGMCGAANTNNVRKFRAAVKADDKVGVKQIQVVGEKGRKLLQVEYGSDIKLAVGGLGRFHVLTLKNVAYLTDKVLETDYDAMEIFYLYYKSSLSTRAESTMSYPPSAISQNLREAFPDHQLIGDSDVVQNFYEFQFCTNLYLCLQENDISVISTRARAMDEAGKATDSLGAALAHKLNKIRQNQITTDLIEVSTATEAALAQIRKEEEGG